MIRLDYLMVLVLCQIFKIILSMSSKHDVLSHNPPIKIYISQIENRITFRIASGHLEFLKTEKLKLLGSTKKNN